MYQGGNAMVSNTLNKKSTSVKVLFFALIFVTGLWAENGWAKKTLEQCNADCEKSFTNDPFNKNQCKQNCVQNDGSSYNSIECGQTGDLFKAVAKAQTSCEKMGKDKFCYLTEFSKCKEKPSDDFFKQPTVQVLKEVLLGGMDLNSYQPRQCVTESKKTIEDKIKDLKDKIKDAEKEIAEAKKDQINDKKDYDKEQKDLNKDLKDIQKELRENKLEANKEMAEKSSDFAEFQRSVPGKQRELRTAIEKAKMSIMIQQQVLMKMNVSIIKAECNAQAKKKAVEYKATIGTNLSKDRDDAIKQTYILCVEQAIKQSKANEQKALNEITENQNSIRDNTEKMTELQSELVEREAAFKQEMEMNKKNLTEMEQEAYQRQIDVNKGLVESTKNYIALAKSTEEKINKMNMSIYAQKMELTRLQQEANTAVTGDKDKYDVYGEIRENNAIIDSYQQCCDNPDFPQNAKTVACKSRSGSSSRTGPQTK